jgi:xanthine dehydrogenase iron-sulfur cluster and FAD-binding subunit A
MWQNYYVPGTIDETLGLLAQYRKEARVVAGGTDLIVEIERGARSPTTIVDISRIPDFDRIVFGENGLIYLGPMVTHNRVVGSALCVEKAYPLARACAQVGAPQIRNRGTVVGNLITASPANDTIAPLYALDAKVTLLSVRGKRTLSFEDFFLGVRQTALADDELLASISFSALAANERGTFLKLGLRQAQAVSVVNVAVVLAFEDDKVSRARIALGSVAPTIIRVPEAEAALVGQELDAQVIEEAGRLAAAASKPISDIRGSAGYRREMVRVLTVRALRALRNGSERADWPERPVMLWGATDGRFPPLSGPLRHYDASGDGDINCLVNGRPVTVSGASDKTLLRMLREDLGLTGTKEGCAEGECGACTVLLDGIAVLSCLVPAPRADGCQVVTVEGLAKDGQLHPLQQSFIETGAVQCGYCTPGLLMSGAALLAERPHPTPDEARQAITGNLCRCTGYYKILEAIERAGEGREVS